MARTPDGARAIRPPEFAAAGLARRGGYAVPPPGFAALLDRAGAPLRRTGHVAAFETAAGIAIFMGPQCGLHLLSWQPHGPARRFQADLAAIDGNHAASAWHHVLLPAADGFAAAHTVTGLAAFDAEGLKARFEFPWIRAPHGEWTLDAPVPARVARNGALEPVGGPNTALWPNSCGRCLRYPLARQFAAPQLSLCRRECLARVEPF